MPRLKREGSEDARRHLPALIDRASRGETTVITRRGTPCAAIVPMSELAARKAGIQIRDLRGSGRSFWHPNTAAWIRKLRREWK